MLVCSSCALCGLTAVGVALFSGASDLIPIFVHTPTLADAAVTLGRLEVALLSTAWNIRAWKHSGGGGEGRREKRLRDRKKGSRQWYEERKSTVNITVAKVWSKIWSLLLRACKYVSCDCNQSSCVFTEVDQQSITAVKVAGQQPYILFKGKQQSLSITHTHTYFLLPSFDPVQTHFSSFFVASWNTEQSARMGADDMCHHNVRTCFIEMCIVYLTTTTPFACFSQLKRVTVPHLSVCMCVCVS